MAAQRTQHRALASSRARAVCDRGGVPTHKRVQPLDAPGNPPQTRQRKMRRPREDEVTE